MTWATITGADLRKARKAAGLSQTTLAWRAGIGRHAVSYWECKAALDLRGWAVERMVKALGPENLPDYWAPNARAGGWGNSWPAAERLAMEAQIERQLAAHREREAQRIAKRRVICGAKTRKGAPCRNKSEPGKARCKFHGGKSTGARTPEGKARIVEAQRRRWIKYRAEIAENAALNLIADARAAQAEVVVPFDCL